MIERDAVQWAFEHFYHMDCANAKVHCAPVKFSPITFNMYHLLMMWWPDGEDITQEMAHVMTDVDKYELDAGR